MNDERLPDAIIGRLSRVRTLESQLVDRLEMLRTDTAIAANEPRAFLDIYAEFCARTCLFVRPAAQAAVELGTETF